MDPRTAHSKLDEAVFLDVREPHEWDAGHIEGALHIPISELATRAVEIPKDREVVVVCHIGQRSALVATFLAQNGFNAHNLEGGLESWAAHSLPLTIDG